MSDKDTSELSAVKPVASSKHLASYMEHPVHGLTNSNPAPNYPHQNDGTQKGKLILPTALWILIVVGGIGFLCLLSSLNKTINTLDSLIEIEQANGQIKGHPSASLKLDADTPHYRRFQHKDEDDSPHKRPGHPKGDKRGWMRTTPDDSMFHESSGFASMMSLPPWLSLEPMPAPNRHVSEIMVAGPFVQSPPDSIFKSMAEPSGRLGSILSGLFGDDHPRKDEDKSSITANIDKINININTEGRDRRPHPRRRPQNLVPHPPMDRLHSVFDDQPAPMIRNRNTFDAPISSILDRNFGVPETMFGLPELTGLLGPKPERHSLGSSEPWLSPSILNLEKPQVSESPLFGQPRIGKSSLIISVEPAQGPNGRVEVSPYELGQDSPIKNSIVRPSDNLNSLVDSLAQSLSPKESQKPETSTEKVIKKISDDFDSVILNGGQPLIKDKQQSLAISEDSLANSNKDKNPGENQIKDLFTTFFGPPPSPLLFRSSISSPKPQGSTAEPEKVDTKPDIVAADNKVTQDPQVSNEIPMIPTGGIIEKISPPIEKGPIAKEPEVPEVELEKPNDVTRKDLDQLVNGFIGTMFSLPKFENNKEPMKVEAQADGKSPDLEPSGLDYIIEIA